jgi:hypothetical protein
VRRLKRYVEDHNFQKGERSRGLSSAEKHKNEGRRGG